MDLSRALEEHVLHRVDKPSRYLGSELHAVRKDPESVDLRLALVFPDLYDLGLGNLGLHILYAVVNDLPWAAAERVCAPWVDMEAELRGRGLPLFALESRDPVAAFHGVGFTLQSELTYTNVLNLLDLAGIPLRAEDRGEDHPLVFAGGPTAVNPEPMAPFFDFFVLGDGEEALVEVAEVMRATLGRPRHERLGALAGVDGVYVPLLARVEALDDGTLVVPDLQVDRRVIADLDAARYPTDYLVPFTRQVHDRVGLEVLRGCTHGCRFCQAGMTTRPVRERSVDAVVRLMSEALDRTGYEEVSLVSLSTCDHSRIRHLLEQTVALAEPRHVGVSLPSLRLDTYSVDLAAMVQRTRRTGLTFAPEAATPRLRAVINKWIPDEDLLEMSAAAFSRGWDHVKLYFMIGLPTETDEDVRAIAHLARRVLRTGREHNPRAHVNLGVSTFVPKAHTPLQWCAQIDLEEIEARQDVLEAALGRTKAIKFGRHDPRETWVEGLLSRADRRAADLVEAAWRRGARFDAWSEHLRLEAWEGALEDTGYDAAGALAARDPALPTPWDHVHTGVSRAWLAQEHAAALAQGRLPDCREGKCNRCGVNRGHPALCTTMLERSAGREDQLLAPPEAPRQPPEAPPVVQRLWVQVCRTDRARFLSHLEALNTWIRALRRAGTPLAWSQGFHPHPRLAFAGALPQGHETTADVMDLLLTTRVDPEVWVEGLRAVLPPGFDATRAVEVDRKAPAPMAVARGGRWRVRLDADDLHERVSAVLAAERLPVVREKKAKRKKGRRRGPPRITEVDVRAMIHRLAVVEPGVVELVMGPAAGAHPKAREVVALLTDEPRAARVLQVETLDADLRPLMEPA